MSGVQSPFATLALAISLTTTAQAQGSKLSSNVALMASPNPSQSGQVVTFTATVSTQSGPLTGTQFTPQLIALGLQTYIASQQPWNFQGDIIENYDPTKNATVRLYAASFGSDYISPLVQAPNPNPTPYVDFDLLSGEILATSPCCTSPTPTTATFPPNGTNITSITASGHGAPLISANCAYPTNCPIQPGVLNLTVSIVPPASGSFSGVNLWLQYPAPANGPLPIDPSLGTLTLSDGSTALSTLGFTDNGTGQVTFATSSLSAGTHTIHAVYSGDDNFDGSSATVTQVVNPPPSPILTLSSNSLNFTYQMGGQLPDTQTLTLSSANISSLNYAITSNETWLSASSSMGSTTANIGVSVSPTGLAVGTYKGSLTISGAGASNSPQTVSVELSIVGPSASVGAVTNAASYGTAASGGAATIFGTFPGSTTASPASTPLPTVLNHVTVFIDGIAAPLYYISPTQINVQIPWEVNTDPHATITISNGVWNAVGNANVQSSSPGIVEVDSQHNAAILHLNFKLVSAADPAVPGEPIIVFATGLGPVSPSQLDGMAASSVQLANTIAPTQVQIGSKTAPTSFSGLAPGFVGLYQINTIVPQVNAGPNAITLTVNGSLSNAASIEMTVAP